MNITRVNQDKTVFVNRSRATKETGFSYLGTINSSSKIEKGTKQGIDTFVLYLAPWKLSGYQVCPMAKTCIDPCLNLSGRSKFDEKIQLSRIGKTKLFFENRDYFNNWLFTEIEANKKLVEEKGNKFAVRINGTSDLSPVLFKVDGVSILDKFNDVTFYDYTKVANRFNLTNSNYHLTFSFDGTNWTTSKDLLNQEKNVSIVFNVKKDKPLPDTYKGFRVIDGDTTDYRPNDDKGVIVGLRFKITKEFQAMTRKQRTQFINDSKFIITDKNTPRDNRIA